MTDHQCSAAPRWQLGLRRFFERPSVELVIGTLIVVSVSMTLTEFALPHGEAEHIERINDAITWLFVVELSLRFAAAPSKRRFLRQWWPDLLSVLPVLRPLRVLRAIRLLRLLRLLRLIGLASRLASLFPYVARRGVVEYTIALGLIILTVALGSGALLVFEGPENEHIDSLDEAAWFSVYSLFAGEPIVTDEPRSTMGRFVSLLIMFMGMTIFAMFTGTVSAFMVERLQSEGRAVDLNDLSGHVIICGWSNKARIVINEYCTAHKGDDVQVVVIAQLEDEDPKALAAQMPCRVQFLQEDFTRVSVLELAGIHRAATCILMSDTSHGRSIQDADARTILAALTVEKLNASVYTCAELNNRDYGSHLRMGHVNDYVVSGEHSAFLLAQAALNRGIMDVLGELLTYERGNQFYRLALPEPWIGRNYGELFTLLKRDHNAILVAVAGDDGASHVNPTDYTFAPGDDVIVIATEPVRLD